MFVANRSINFSSGELYELAKGTITETYYKKDDTRQFIRKGVAGGFKDELTDNQIQKLDEWIVKNVADVNLRKIFS